MERQAIIQWDQEISMAIDESELQSFEIKLPFLSICDSLAIDLIVNGLRSEGAINLVVS